MSIANLRRHLEIEGPQDSQAVSERTLVSSWELISLIAETQNHSSRSILMVSSPVMCLVHGNTLVNLVNPQVTTRAKS